MEEKHETVHMKRNITWKQRKRSRITQLQKSSNKTKKEKKSHIIIRINWGIYEKHVNGEIVYNDENSKIIVRI